MVSWPSECSLGLWVRFSSVVGLVCCVCVCVYVCCICGDRSVRCGLRVEVVCCLLCLVGSVRMGGVLYGGGA